MQKKSHAATTITLLATTSMLTAISSAAYATPPHICNNPVTRFSNLACWVGDENFTVTHNGTITPAQTATAIAVHTDYSAGSTLTNNGTLSFTINNTQGNGIDFRDDVSGSVVNTGTIDVTVNGGGGSANARGIEVEGLLDGTITNSGSIHVSAAAGNNHSAYAGGITVASVLQGTITNNGLITASTSTTDNENFSYGIDIDNSVASSGAIVNNGTIRAAGTGSYFPIINGVHVNGALDGSIVNNGTISATSNGTGEYAYADGIYVGNGISPTGSITNNGTISAIDTTAVTYAYGYALEIRGDMDGTITNNGTITHTVNGASRAFAEGIYISQGVGGNIINNGTITATAHGGTGTASAWGIYTGNDLTGSITNSGTITATADSGKTSAGYAYGIRVSGDATVASTITNNGTITATINDHGYSVYGIFAGDLDGTMVNNGAVHAIANGVNREFAYGINAGDMYATSSFTNNGIITAAVNGTVTNGGAYGIGVGGDLDSALINTGIVTATYDANPGNAYSIFVSGGIGSIDNSGVLTGRLATGGTVAVTNSGLIAAPANQNGAAGGVVYDYTQTGDGKLILGVASNAIYSQFDVNHNADFTGSGKLGVMLSADNTYAGGALANVVDVSDTLTGASYTVTDNSLAWNFTATKDANTVDLTAAATGLTTLVNAVNTTGHSADSGAAAALDGLLTGGSTEMIDELSDIFGGVTTNQQAAAGVAQFVPTLAAGVQQVLMDTGHTTTRIVQSRLDGQSGVSSGENFSAVDRNFWVKPFGSWTSQDSRNGAAGYDASTGGAVFGGDALLKDKLRLGLAFAYAHSNLDGDVSGQNDRIDTYQGIVYGSYNIAKATDATFQFDVADNTNQGRRGVAGATAFSSYDAWAEHAGVGIERAFALDSATTFIPALRADYTTVHSDAYAETGASPFNLNVDGSSAQELIVGIDGKFNHQLSKTVTLSGNLGLGYDTLNGRTAIASSFAGGSAAFVTPGINPSPWIGNGGLGLTVAAWHNVDVTARYDIEAREDFTQQTASLKLRMPF